MRPSWIVLNLPRKCLRFMVIYSSLDSFVLGTDVPAVVTFPSWQSTSGTSKQKLATNRLVSVNEKLRNTTPDLPWPLQVGMSRQQQQDGPPVPPQNANQDFKYFYEDEVFRLSKRGALQFGMVVENAEFISSDESSDDEHPPVRPGHVRVAWYPSGKLRLSVLSRREEILIFAQKTGWLDVTKHFH